MNGSKTNDREDQQSGRDRLIESLWEDARREAEPKIQKARAEAENLFEEDRLLRERELAMAADKARIEALPQTSRVLNHARNRARQIVLEERHSFLNLCFEGVSALLGKDNGFKEEARAAFEPLLTQALSALGDQGRIEASLNPEDMAHASRILEKSGLEHELFGDENIAGGVVLQAKGGSIVVDNTLEGRLGALREAPPIDLFRLICQNLGG